MSKTTKLKSILTVLPTVFLISCNGNPAPNNDELESQLSVENFALGKFRVDDESGAAKTDIFEFAKNGEYSFTQFVPPTTSKCLDRIVHGKWQLVEDALSIMTHSVDVYQNCQFVETSVLNPEATVFFDFTLLGQDSFSVKSSLSPYEFEVIRFVKAI